MISPEQVQLLAALDDVDAKLAVADLGGARALHDSLFDGEEVRGPVAFESGLRGTIKTEGVLPPHASPMFHIVFIHGGSLICGYPQLFRSFTTNLAVTAQARVETISYRLAPENTTESAFDDVDSGLRNILDALPQSVFVAVVADEVGSYLALRSLAGIDAQHGRQADLLFCVSPWTSVDRQLDDSATNLERVALPCWDQRPPSLQDLDWEDLPPIQVLASSTELHRDDASSIVAMATAAGVDCGLTLTKDVAPRWPLFPSSQESQDAIKFIVHMIDEFSRSEA